MSMRVCKCRGLGRQASLMWFNILGFWAVGFTTGYTLTFRFHWGLPGVWWGILSGVMVTGQYLSNPAMMLSQYGLDQSFCFILPFWVSQEEWWQLYPNLDHPFTAEQPIGSKQ